MSQYESLAQRIEKAREKEQVYEASKEVHGEMWTQQAEQMLEWLRNERMHLERKLEERLLCQQ